jgi:site-specific DNA recombinase
MKRAAVYIRMSTDDQAGSPDRQRSLILPYCERKGYIVVEVYEDLGMRGWDDARPSYLRLMDDAKKRRFDIIVVDEQSRLCRNDPYEFAATVAFPLKQAGVALELVDQGQRLTWDDDDLAGLLLGVIGQYKASQESSTLGRRTATGMARKAKDGKMFVGRAAYGFRYRKDGDGNRVCLEPDSDHPEKVEIVRRVFDAYINRDLSLIAIVAELNALGVPSPQGRDSWGKTTVHNILTNHVYAGSYVWGKVPQGRYFRCDGAEVVPVGHRKAKSSRRPPQDWLVIPGQHEPLVEPAVFDKVQERLAANRIRTSPSRKKGSYPLSQLMVCSHCGAPMYGTKRLSGGRWEAVYRCGSDMDKGTCAPRTVRENVVMDKIVEVLQEQLLDPENRTRLEAEMSRQRQQEVGKHDGAIKDLRAKVARLDTQITKAKGNLARLDSEFIADVQAQIREWQGERAGANVELERLERRSPSGSAERLVAKVEKLVKVFRSGDPSLVRPALRESVGRVDLRFDEVRKAKVTRYPLAGGVVHLVGEEECVDSSCSETGLICTSKSRPCPFRNCPPRPMAPPAPTCASRSTGRGGCSGSASGPTVTGSTRR